MKVGDRVRIISGDLLYREGIIRDFNVHSSVGVEFDEHIAGHDLGNDNYKDGYCWWLSKNDLEVVESGIMQDIVREVPNKQNLFELTLDIPQDAITFVLTKKVEVNGISYLAKIELEKA